MFNLLCLLSNTAIKVYFITTALLLRMLVCHCTSIQTCALGTKSLITHFKAHLKITFNQHLFYLYFIARINSHISPVSFNLSQSAITKSNKIYIYNQYDSFVSRYFFICNAISTSLDAELTRPSIQYALKFLQNKALLLLIALFLIR